MVSKSTANVKAKKDLSKKKEDYRLNRPCPYCGSPLNTLARFFGHTKTVCKSIQENPKGNIKTK